MPAFTSIALGALAAGTAASAVGGFMAADAQGKAANAQLTEAERTREAAVKAAEPSPQEILALDRSIQLAEAGVARQERILDAVDPTLIEAGEQALELLHGKDAQILDPIRNQRERDRQNLRQNLASQMGAGFEQSAAGIRALNEFDNQTNQLLANAQLAAVGQLLGTATEARRQISPLQGALTFANLSDALAGPSKRKVAAITQTPITPYAGAPFVGAAAQGQALNTFGGGLAQLGTTGLLFNALGSQPTATTQSGGYNLPAMQPIPSPLGGK